MEFHMINTIYAALPKRAQTEKATFLCKDDSRKALHMFWSGGMGLVHWRSTHGAGHILLCSIIFHTFCTIFCKASSLLCHIILLDPSPRSGKNVSFSVIAIKNGIFSASFKKEFWKILYFIPRLFFNKNVNIYLILCMIDGLCTHYFHILEKFSLLF